MKRIWVTWERQRRNLELSRALSCDYHEFNYDDRIRGVRYLCSIYRTFRVVREGKPGIVFGQNPSIVLVLTLVILKKIFGFKLIIDAHNAGVYPCEGKYTSLNALMARLNDCADLLLVTNASLEETSGLDARKVYVLPDKVPEFSCREKIELEGKFNILFICKFHDDEPYREVFEAVKGLPHDVVVYVTGNHKRISKEVTGSLPANLKLIGFVPEQVYESMLNSVDAVMDLTTRDHCLLCGAYEAVGAEKPMVLSKTEALMNYFDRGSVFVENNPEKIKEGIEELMQRYGFYSEEIIVAKKAIDCRWNSLLSGLNDLVDNMKDTKEQMRSWCV